MIPNAPNRMRNFGLELSAGRLLPEGSHAGNKHSTQGL